MNALFIYFCIGMAFAFVFLLLLIEAWGDNHEDTKPPRGKESVPLCDLGSLVVSPSDDVQADRFERATARIREEEKRFA